ncbi:MAG: hypothetical protein PVSMB1_06130 [Gemmatimonadaceae bacterium]
MAYRAFAGVASGGPVHAPSEACFYSDGVSGRDSRDLLESTRHNRDAPDRQAFHAGIQRPRELKHDAQVYRAYLHEAERLREEGANIHRVILDNELKAEYQGFLQERNRDREDSDGRPDRKVEEI